MLIFDNVSKHYQTADGVVKALDGLNLTVDKGDFAVIKGPSGCGKSTLLLHAGGMLRPTEGTISVNGQEIYQLSNRERGEFRQKHVGFVFQMFHLLPYLTVRENALLAAPNRGAEADALIERLGLSERRHHLPSALSAGEKQRTAIARALLPEPDLILADEPTGNLDPENAALVMQYLRDYQASGGTVIVVTHGTDGNQFATRSIQLKAGAQI
ncbi:MAG: ABC transporter ATP-binding protein [Candidatus Hydrogenedentes bacterium]|nr:ABC transporter ATP-binding protein [Candidatus Hydrogenedentota bacterium]